MEQRGDTDTVELMTRGSLVHKDGAYYIVYKETETTGYEGLHHHRQGGRRRPQGFDAALRQAVEPAYHRRAPAISAIMRPATARSVLAWPPMSLSMR